jgi:site-specific recombinase
MRSLRRLRKHWRLKKRSAFAPAEETLRSRVELFISASTLNAQTRRAGALFAYIWTKPTDRGFIAALLRLIRLLELDKDLRARFDVSWQTMLDELDSLPLFADAGLPTHNGLWREASRRVFQRLLPTARKDSDTARLFTAIFSSPNAVERFLALKEPTYIRLTRILWPKGGRDAVPHVDDDINQALTLLAMRVGGRGVTAAVRERGSSSNVEESPFYKLVFVTETFLQAEPGETQRRELQRWLDSVHACRSELIQVRLHMEDAGVSTALVFDLSSMDASLDRMQLLAATRT